MSGRGNNCPFVQSRYRSVGKGFSHPHCWSDSVFEPKGQLGAKLTQNLAAGNPLHQRAIFVEGFLQKLSPMQPVITSFDLRSEERFVVPGIYGDAGQEESVRSQRGPAEDSAHAIFKTAVTQNIL